MLYVGDDASVAFTATPGSSVTVTVIDPSGDVVHDEVAVPEDGGEAGSYPFTWTLASVGLWEARFRAGGGSAESYYVRADPVTGPPPLATVTEVGDEYGTMTPAQEELTAVLIRRASALVRARWPDLIARVAAGTLDPMAPAGAVINMVLRVLRNPAGLRAESVGPFSRAYDTTYAVGLVVITPIEEDLMVPGAAEVAAGVPRSVIGSPTILGRDPWRGDRRQRPPRAGRSYPWRGEPYAGR